jgi:hypothetical protein
MEPAIYDIIKKFLMGWKYLYISGTLGTAILLGHKFSNTYFNIYTHTQVGDELLKDLNDEFLKHDIIKSFHIDVWEEQLQLSQIFRVIINDYPYFEISITDYINNLENSQNNMVVSETRLFNDILRMLLLNFIKIENITYEYNILQEYFKVISEQRNCEQLNSNNAFFQSDKILLAPNVFIWSEQLYNIESINDFINFKIEEYNLLVIPNKYMTNSFYILNELKYPTIYYVEYVLSSIFLYIDWKYIENDYDGRFEDYVCNIVNTYLHILPKLYNNKSMQLISLSLDVSPYTSPVFFGYGIEHETEIHRKYIEEFDFKYKTDTYPTEEMFNMEHNTSKNYYEYNNQMGKYINDNNKDLTVYVDTKPLYIIGSIIDKHPSVKTWIESLNIASSSVKVTMIQNLFKNAFKNMEETTKSFKRLKSLENDKFVVGEISNYIGENCKHGDIFTGNNCHFEFVTGYHENLTIDKCFLSLQQIETRFLHYFKLFYPDCFYPKFCSHPFLMYYDEKYIPQIKYNKSGSIHINISLPTIIKKTEEESEPTKYTLPTFTIPGYDFNQQEFIVMHLKYARILQLISPLFVAYYGTPDFKAVYMIHSKNYKIQKKIGDPRGFPAYTNSSFRLLSSNSPFSPLPCICDLFSSFENGRIIKTQNLNPNIWYSSMKDMGFLKNYATRDTNHIGLDFRRDPSKGEYFGFEFRILDDFAFEHLEKLLYLITYIADLTQLINENMDLLGNYKSTLKYFIYDPFMEQDTTSPQNNSLVYNKEFNVFVVDIIINGMSTNIKKHYFVMNLFNHMFFVIPKILLEHNNPTTNYLEYENEMYYHLQTLNIKTLLDEINTSMYNLTYNYKKPKNSKLYSDYMISTKKNKFDFTKGCVNEDAIEEYKRIIKIMDSY